MEDAADPPSEATAEDVVTPLRSRIEGGIDQHLGAAFERAGTYVPDSVRPKLRGWLHLGAVPLAVPAGIVLIVAASGTAEVVAATIYAVTTVLLFSVSAFYHRGRWSPRVANTLKRIDHANIFLIIAGTYTPFAVLLLTGTAREALLWTIWTTAALGVAFRVFWVGAPRWLYVLAYMALGWAAVFYVGAFLHSGGVWVLVLIALGGLLYTLGGVVYGLKRPDPYPSWFGFHEVFHTLTLLAYMCHYAAVSIVVYTH